MMKGTRFQAMQGWERLMDDRAATLIASDDRQVARHRGVMWSPPNRPDSTRT